MRMGKSNQKAAAKTSKKADPMEAKYGKKAASKASLKNARPKEKQKILKKDMKYTAA